MTLEFGCQENKKMSWGAEEMAHGLKHWLFFQTQRGSQRCATPVPGEPMASSDLCRTKHEVYICRRNTYLHKTILFKTINQDVG